jgi:hypothetical protein
MPPTWEPTQQYHTPHSAGQHAEIESKILVSITQIQYNCHVAAGHSHIVQFALYCNMGTIFDVHMSVHHKYISKVQPTKCNVYSIYLFL